MFNFFKKNIIIDENFLAELEEKLLLADIGIKETGSIIEELRKTKSSKELPEEEITNIIKNILITKLKPYEKKIEAVKKPLVFLIMGVNGSGKTTTISKLTYLLQKKYSKILLAAADTFRAGAKEQLKTLGESLKVDVFIDEVKDPSAIAYKSYKKAEDENYDILIIDTAGRQPSNTNLMKELQKIEKTLQKLGEDLPHESILILDGTLGQSSVNIVESFAKEVKINNLIITKLDYKKNSNAKGGTLIEIISKFKIPVLYIGTGEKKEDIEPFSAKNYVDNLFNT